MLARRSQNYFGSRLSDKRQSLEVMGAMSVGSQSVVSLVHGRPYCAPRTITCVVLRDYDLPSRRVQVGMSKSLARVASDFGALHLSVESPYEWELLLDHAAHHAQNSSGAKVTVNGRSWWVVFGVDMAQRCIACGRMADGLSYCWARHMWCRGCVRRDSILAQALMPTHGRIAPTPKERS